MSPEQVFLFGRKGGARKGLANRNAKKKKYVLKSNDGGDSSSSSSSSAESNNKKYKGPQSVGCYSPKKNRIDLIQSIIIYLLWASSTTER